MQAASVVPLSVVDGAKSVVEGAKRVVRGKTADPVAQLAKDLVPVKAVLARWGEIEAAHVAKCNVSAYIEYRDACRAKFKASKSPEDHGKVFVAESILQERVVEVNFAEDNKRHGTLESEWLQLPGLRDSIKKAVRSKIEAVKLEATPERILVEQRRLAELNDFDGCANVKKNAAASVEFWEGRLAHLEKRDAIYDPVNEAQRFLSAAKQLLEGDEGKGKFVHKTEGDIYELVRVDEVADQDLIAYQHTHFLQSAVGNRSWEGTRSDFEQCFTKL